MSHDPLCMETDEWETFKANDGHMSIRRKCFCDLIRAAREDERGVQPTGYEDSTSSYSMGYAAALRDVFGFHPEWTVTGMCKPDCPACLRLTELINERSEGHKEGLRDAVEAVKALLVMPCPADETPWTTDEGLQAAVAALEALGGER